MSELASFKVALTPRNISRLRNGHTVQLKADQIGGAVSHTHVIKLSGVYAKKLTLAQKKNAGTKIQLSKQEIEASGLNARDIGRALKKVADVYKKNVRPVVGPAIRDGLTKAVKVALPAAAVAIGAPELAPVASAVANQFGSKAVNALGDVTGAYGVKGKKKFVLSNTRSTMIGSQHPAMSPGMPIHDHSVGGALRKAIMRGGSFLPAGAGI